MCVWEIYTWDWSTLLVSYNCSMRFLILFRKWQCYHPFCSLPAILISVGSSGQPASIAEHIQYKSSSPATFQEWQWFFVSICKRNDGPCIHETRAMEWTKQGTNSESQSYRLLWSVKFDYLPAWWIYATHLQESTTRSYGTYLLASSFRNMNWWMPAPACFLSVHQHIKGIYLPSYIQCTQVELKAALLWHRTLLISLALAWCISSRRVASIFFNPSLKLGWLPGGLVKAHVKHTMWRLQTASIVVIDGVCIWESIFFFPSRHMVCYFSLFWKKASARLRCTALIDRSMELINYIATHKSNQLGQELKATGK